MKPIITKTIKVETIENGKIDYQNGVFCDYTIVNDVLTKYNFYTKENIRLNLLEENNINELINNHWSQHYKVFKGVTLTTFEELENFNNFDNLVYIGGGSDGMLKNYKNELINSVVSLDSTYFRIYQQLETSEKEVETYLENLNSEYIKYSKIEYTPYYNQDADKTEHYTLSLEVLLPLDLYKQAHEGLKHTCDIVKGKIVEILKNK